MIRLLSSVCAALALLSPTLARAETPKEVRDSVARSLDALHAAASKADEKTYFGLWTPGAVFIGTEASERWTIEDFRKDIAPLFAQGKGYTYVPRERHIDLLPAPCNCVAAFDELLDSAKYGVARDSGVAVRGEDGVWRVAQYHLTLPIPNAIAVRLTDEIKAYAAGKRP